MPVSDVRVKPIPITLEKERTLKYDLNAFAELEERFGTVQQAFDELQKQKLKAVRAIVWAGLIHEDPKLTERQVGSMLSFADLTGILPAVTEAITAALPKASEDATEKTRKPGHSARRRVELALAQVSGHGHSAEE
ncbi:hypothetical protein GCM10025857_39740 [Alicyclobacillus contaminans]|nr:hypothetical protein GCM10025857_00210 [Alicyclobacillus contaminans]GMA52617.1 hypothetical protein GCM10025857_39740 [Alicyclobacillus contaminans]